jgi:hypothetical protein
MLIKKNAGSYLFIFLPLILFLLLFLIAGFYYEENDDVVISFLIRGIYTGEVVNISEFFPYLYGWSTVLVWLYQALPAMPWHGILMYLCLLLSTILVFKFLIYSLQCFKDFSLYIVSAFLTAFFVFIWADHLLNLSFARVSILLTSSALLLFIPIYEQNKRNKPYYYLAVYCVLFIGFCIRPSTALFGLLIVAPCFFFIKNKQDKFWKRFIPVCVSFLIIAVFFIYINHSQTLIEKDIRQKDVFLAGFLDFGIYQFDPQSKADILTLNAIKNWFFADNDLIDYSFFNRTFELDLDYIISEAGPRKIKKFLHSSPRNHFLFYIVNLILVFQVIFFQKLVRKRWIILYQLYFWGMVFFFVFFLKFPDRVAVSFYSLYTLVNIYLFSNYCKPENLKFLLQIKLLIALTLLFESYKLFIKVSNKKEEAIYDEKTNENINKRYKDKILVSSALHWHFKGLSPFINYDFGNNILIPITGWNTLQPSCLNQIQHITGKLNFKDGLYELSKRTDVIWLLHKDFYPLLQEYYSFPFEKKFNLKELPYKLSHKQPIIPFQNN